jgi:hypothetical protein
MVVISDQSYILYIVYELISDVSVAKQSYSELQECHRPPTKLRNDARTLEIIYQITTVNWISLDALDALDQTRSM